MREIVENRIVENRIVEDKDSKDRCGKAQGAALGRTLVKICGLRRPQDAEAANRAGQDLAGFILTPGFGRSIRLEEAVILRKNLLPRIRTVGVFVNAPLSEILAAADSGCIDMIQLHGNESEADIRQIAGLCGIPVIRAFRISDREDLVAAASTAADWVLLDSGAGTGQVFDWDLLEDFMRENRRPEDKSLFPGGHPWILAGGLSAGNAARAVCRFSPTAVDVSSNVETNGWKDPAKMKAFVEAVRGAGGSA